MSTLFQVARVPPVPHQTEAAVAMTATAVDTNNPWDLVPDQSKIKIHSRYPGTRYLKTVSATLRTCLIS
jgi:hypothetical protein